LFAAVVTDSQTQAVVEKQIKQLPIGTAVDSIAKFLTENQAENSGDQ
jgi:hypothetical protein